MDTIRAIHHEDRDMLFEGELNFIGLADIFQILGGNNSTGVLHMTSPYCESPGKVYFTDGNLTNASFNSLHGLDAIYALFGWTEGIFEFHREKIHKRRAVDQSLMQIILDALRMLDDGLIKTVGPPRFVDSPGGLEQASCAWEAGTLSVIKGPLVDYMYIVQEEYLSEGDRVITEGAYGNWVWVILEGSVRITRDSLRGPLLLAQLGEGCFIGTFASFLFSDYVRTATVTAIGDVHLGLLDTQRLAGEFAALSDDFRSVLLIISNKLKEVSDKGIVLLAEGTNEQDVATGRLLVPEAGQSIERAAFSNAGCRSIPTPSKQASFALVPVKKEDVLRYFLFNHSRAENRAHRDDSDLMLDTEKLKKEYDGLSRTFKNMIDYLASCIAVTNTLVHQLDRNRTLLIENPKPSGT